ncbi:MAG: hypothetical protein ACRCTE_01275 [Cellulosilyticaceae bacterium]
MITYTANITRTIEEMKEDAKIEEKLDIAKKMLLEGMNTQVVSNLTGLNIERVEELKVLYS